MNRAQAGVGWRFVRFRILVAVAVCCVLPAPPATAQPDTAFAGGDGVLGIHFLDVGQGDATLVVCPNGERVLVDAGSLPLPSPSRTEAYRSSLRALLDPEAPRIDTLVVTHPDGDHFGLLPTMLANVRRPFCAIRRSQLPPLCTCVPSQLVSPYLESAPPTSTASTRHRVAARSS